MRVTVFDGEQFTKQTVQQARNLPEADLVGHPLWIDVLLDDVEDAVDGETGAFLR